MTVGHDGTNGRRRCMLVMAAVMVAYMLRGRTRRRMIVLAADVHPRQGRLRDDHNRRQQQREQRRAIAVHHGSTGVHYCQAPQTGQ